MYLKVAVMTLHQMNRTKREKCNICSFQIAMAAKMPVDKITMRIWNDHLSLVKPPERLQTLSRIGQVTMIEFL